MRTSELYQRYIESIVTVAKAAESTPDWQGAVESLVRQFHSETMPMMRPPFRKMRDDMAAELEAKARSCPEGHVRDAFFHAAGLLKKL